MKMRIVRFITRDGFRGEKKVGAKNLSPAFKIQEVGKCSVYESGQGYLDLTRFSLFTLFNISIPIYSIFLILFWFAN